MYTVKKIHLPERKQILFRKTLPAQDRYVVVDEHQEISWNCQTQIAAEMYAACKNHDAEFGTNFERELDEYLNGVQYCG